MANLKSTTQSGTSDTSTLQNVLGTAATLGGLYKNLGGSAGIGNLWNTGANWLSGGSSGFVADPNAYAFGTQYWE
jgi:hypothetical protein